MKLVLHFQFVDCVRGERIRLLSINLILFMIKEILLLLVLDIRMLGNEKDYGPEQPKITRSLICSLALLTDLLALHCLLLHAPLHPFVRLLTPELVVKKCE